jgi:hypothetical protein
MKEWYTYSQKKCSGFTWGQKIAMLVFFLNEVVDTVAHQLAKMC